MVTQVHGPGEDDGLFNLLDRERRLGRKQPPAGVHGLRGRDGWQRCGMGEPEGGSPGDGGGGTLLN